MDAKSTPSLSKVPSGSLVTGSRAGSSNGSEPRDETQRQLKSRHIQLIGIGGTIGTALYVQIGKGLIAGGPASLFIAFSVWCTFILAVTICMAEMVTYLPISSPFVRFAGRYLDEAFGFAAGWNFFIFEAALVPFEIVACNIIITYWTDAIPTAVIICTILVLYGAINVLAVQFYGEIEFWAALGKMLLIIGLIIFTVFVMLGANPLGDRFGFRYWKDPGAFAESFYTGSLGKFLGFMQCLVQASFSIAGPEYVSMSAAEAVNPRKVMPRAFNAVFYRLTAFFVLGSLAVGILVPYDDATLIDAFSKGEPGAAASPYVVAMARLKIGVLPHVVNALVLTAAFSAGNSYVYCASRSLYGLVLERKAPQILNMCTKAGCPLYCVFVVLVISLLSFLQLSENSAKVLSWFVSLVTASQMINFCVMCSAYLGFFYAMRSQGISRDTLPYKGILQPYAAWYGLVGTFTMTFVGGYAVFLPGNWDIPTFLFSYTMVMVVPVMFVVWKLLKGTTWRRREDVDLISGVEEVEEYTMNYVEEKETDWYNRILDKIFG
ncbi:hypothetical protein BROUX41_006213 [Berkeleyomyces rouxiae]|uniref:uncharacterized protein n=1 Tax=Berkeleyomyces rouxiae TaxID=2035830 RepID=UPI003B78224E